MALARSRPSASACPGSKLAIGSSARSIGAGSAARSRPIIQPHRLGANLDGMLAEHAVLSEEALVRMPSHLSFEEAATLPCVMSLKALAVGGHVSLLGTSLSPSRTGL